MKFIVSFLISFSAFSVFSQFKSKTELKSIRSPQKEYSILKQDKKEIQKEPIHDEYIVYKEKLKTYFINDQIPSDFPKYIDTLSYKENKRIAIDWAYENSSLLKENFRSELIKLK